MSSRLLFSTRRPHLVEILEARVVPASLTWIGGDGNWNDNSKWALTEGADADGIPDADDIATINPAGDVTVTITDVRAALSLAMLGDDNLTLSSGSLTLGAASTIHDLSISNATLVGTGQVTLTGGGTLGSEATFFGAIRNEGSLTLAGGVVHIRQDALFNNAGLFTQTGGRIDFNDSNAVFNNLAGGVFEVRIVGDAPFVGNFSNSESFNNAGILRRDGTGAARIDGVTFNNQAGGTFELLNGTLQLNGSGTLTGAAMTTSAGAVLTFGGGAFTVNGTLTATGAGAVRTDNGTLTGNTDAIFNFPAGQFTWDSEGTLYGTWRNNGFIQIASGVAHLRQDATLNNASTIVQTGGRLDFNDSNATINNLGGAVYEVNLPGNNPFVGNFSNSENFNNAGLIRRNGIDTARLDGVTLNNLPGGSFEVVNGTLQLNGTGVFAGAAANVSAGATLTLGGGAFTVNGTLAGTGAGAVRTDNAILTGGTNAIFNFPAGLFAWDSEGTLYGTWRNDGFIQIASGVAHIRQDATLNNAGTIMQTGGRLDFNDSNATLNNLAGAVYDVRMPGDAPFVGNFSNSEQFNNSGTIRRDGTGTARIDGVTLNNLPGGIFEVLSGTLQLNGTGTLLGAAANVNAGATLTLGGGAFTVNGTLTGSGAGAIRTDNSVLTGSAGAVFNFPAGRFVWDSEGTLYGTWTNTGFMQIASGVPHLRQDVVFNNAGTIVQTGGRLDFNDSNAVFNNLAGAVYEVRIPGDAPFVGNFSNSEQFNNFGTLQRDGTGTARIDGVTLNSRSGGIFEVVSGTLQLNGSGTWNEAQFEVASGAIATLGGGGFTINGRLTGNGAGHVRTDNSTLTGSGAATFDFPDELFVWDSEGTLYGTWRNDGFIQIASGVPHLRQDVVFNNAGTIIQTGGRLDFNDSNAVLNNLAGGVFEVRIPGDGPFVGNFSNSEQFTNAGTLLRDGTGTARIDGVTFSSTGLVQVLSGGLQLNGTISNLVNGTLTGGSWTVANGAALSFPAAITTNRADISLTGTAAVPSGIAITQNFGSLVLLGGSDLALGTGSFLNEGSLVLSAGSLLSAASFTQNAGGSLEIEIAGATTADYGRLALTGAANFGGTARVQIASTYTPAAGDALTLVTYGSTTGSFTSFEGLNLARTSIFERFTGPNALVLNALVNAANLDALSITAPATGFAGQDFALSYTVQNTSIFPTVATSWIDTLYLSLDDVLDSSDVVLGRQTHNGALAPGAIYTENLTVPLTGLITGNYKVLVLADSRGFVADPNRADNLVATSTASTLDIPALTDGVALNGTIRAGQELWYRLDVPAGETPNFTFAGAVAGEAELYVSFGEVPTRADYLQKAFALNSTTQQILGEATAAGTYYVLLHGRESAGAGQSFSLEGDTVGFELVSSSLRAGANVGQVTTTFSGAQFSPDTVFTLVPAAGAPQLAEATYFVNTRTVYATFDLTGLTAGTYDIVATRDGATETLDDAFAVTAGGTPGTLKYSIGSPRYVRPQGGTVTITYENVGQTDLAAPLFTLLAENARLQLAGTTGFIGAAYDLDGKPFSVTELLGVSGGLAGILSPGERGTIDLSFQSINATVGQKSRFEVLSIGATNDDFNLATLIEELKPAGLREDAWQALFTNFQAGVGTTVASYRQMLVENANYLGQFETVSPDMTRLLEFELEQAGEFGAIAQRFTLGTLGRGQIAPFSLQASTAPNGTVTLSDGETTRVFFPGAGGTFVGSGLEPGKLSRGAGDVLTLTEANGQKTVFRASDGRIDFIEETNGRRSTAAYDASSQLLSITDSATGDGATYTYNGQGRIATATDAVGRVTSYGYDASGEHLTSVTTPQGTSTFSYITGQGPAVEHALASITGADGVTTSFTYDTRGRITSRTVGTGPDALVTTYEYDNAARQTLTEPGARESQIFRTLGGNATRTIDSLGDVTTVRYDTAGRIISITDPNGLVTKNTLDTAGRLNGIQGADRAEVGVALGGENLRLQSVTDPGGDTTRFIYDPVGNLLSATLPDGAAKTFEYDANGRITATTDGNGQRSTFTYNDDGLVTRRSFPEGQIDFTYDTHRNLLTATDAEGTTTFTYDSADRVTSVAYPNGKTVSIAYDAFGRRATVADGTGYTVRYSYDSLGRLDQVRDTGSALLVDYSYDAIGQLASETRGNGSSTTYTYDAAGRMATITHRDAANVTKGSFAYTYDEQDRVHTVTTPGAGVTTYSYDLAGQLTRAGLPDGRIITYAYDAEGNRTSVTDSAAGAESYATNNGDQYTTAGEETLTYDGDGRLTTRTQGGVTTRYTYDALGNLSGITEPGSVITFDYDALGNRVGKTENGVRTDYANDPFGLGTLFGEYRGGDTTHYASGLGVAARESAGSTSFYHFDAVGNTTLVSGAAGAPVATYQYLPFGAIAAQTGALAQPFTFNGQLGIQDDPGDLFQMRARTYSAELGRFVTRDPIGFAAGDANIYRFAGNDPVNQNDPSGLLTPLQIQAFEYAFGDLAIGEINVAIASLYTEAEAAAIVAGVGSSIPAAASPSAASLIAAGGFAALEAAVVLGGVAVLLDPSLTINAIEHYDQYFRDNRDEHAKKLGYPDPNEPHFSKEFIDEWGKNPYFTDLVKKGLADGQTQQEAILDAVRILKKLGLDKERKPDEKTESEVVRPSDPNNVIGPAGPGADPVPVVIAPGQVRFDGFVTDTADFPYTIQFENQPSATAPAQVVTVTQTLDTDLDLTTFRFTSFGFGDFKIDAPAGSDGTSFETVYDGALATLGVLVQVEAELNVQSGLLQVTFTSLDPLTNEVPADPLAGFLPPNRSAPQGDGFLTYSVAPKTGLANDTDFTAIASIVFDTEGAIATPTVTNTLDLAAPASTITTSSGTSFRPNITVRWASADDATGSGLSGTSIFFTDNDGPLETLTIDDAATAMRFAGEAGHTYRFFSQAIDAVGNLEPIAATPDSTVTFLVPQNSISVTRNSALKFTDANGDQVTVKLKGTGTALVTLVGDVTSGADIDFITTTGTDAKSKLSVSVKKAGAGDGLTTIGDVTVSGTLGAFSASKADLVVNGFAASGSVKSLSVHDVLRPDPVLAAPVIEIGGAVSDTLNLKANILADGFTIDTNATIKRFKAADIGAGRILAAALGTLQSNDGFDASLGIAGEIARIIVKGDVAGATIFADSIDSIKVGGNYTNSVALAGADLGIDFALGGISTSADSFAEGTIGSVAITGNVVAGIIGAGLNPVDAIFNNGDDTVVGGTASSIGKFSVGTADAASHFAASLFKKTPKVDGVKITPASDERFLVV